jgi:hypothetical protein
MKVNQARGNKSAMDVKDFIGLWDFVVLDYPDNPFFTKKNCPVWIKSVPVKYRTSI